MKKKKYIRKYYLEHVRDVKRRQNKKIYKALHQKLTAEEDDGMEYFIDLL